MNNTGQCCVAAKRFIVVEELADRFLEKFQTALAALKSGDPMDKATTLGPLSTEAALVQLLDQVNRAVANGAPWSWEASGLIDQALSCSRRF